MFKAFKELRNKQLAKSRSLKNNKDYWQPVVFLILLLLLPLLAYLQHDWLGQLSVANKVRMKSNLDISIKRFSEDFDRELTRIHELFQIESVNEKDFAKEVTEEFKDWIQSSVFNGLVDSIYFLEISPQNKATLKILDTLNVAFKKTDWPDQLAKLRSVIKKSSGSFSPLLLTLTQAPLLDDNPIIVSQCSNCEFVEDGNFNTSSFIFNYLIVTLDKDYLKNVFIPNLAATYFPQADDISFDLAIAKDEDPANVLYISDSTLSMEDFKQPDASTEIGMWRSHKILIAKAAITSPEVSVNKLEKNIDQKRVSIEIVRTDSTKDTNLFQFLISKTAKWELLVKYKNNSLDQIVQQARNRNLIISYGILILLGISIILVFISSRRAQNLARKQIEFVAGVSHELRTPLAVIRSAGENLADGVIKDKTQLQKYGRVIRDEGRRLSNMVEQTLQFAGLNSMVNAPDRQLLDIVKVVEDSVQSILNVSNGNTPDIKTHIEKPLPEVLADPRALKTAFENIVSNAVKYANNSKPIDINIKHDTNNKQVVIRFRDYGNGISSEDLPHVFEPFYRGNNNNSGNIAGSGLGLSIVENIIQAHSGQVNVESTISNGTTVTITLLANS